MVLLMMEEEKMCGDLKKACSKHKWAGDITEGYCESWV